MPKLTVNVTLCQGYGNCTTNVSDVYDIDDDGKVVLLEDLIDDADRTRVTEAARSHPVNALRVEGLMPGTVAAVGASVAGLRTAQALRAAAHDGPIVLIGAEPGPLYDKPPLSKSFLSGDADLASITVLGALEADAADIELRLGVPAVRLDLTGNQVVLADGAAARPSPWPDVPGVHTLRTLEDGRRLRAALTRRDRASWSEPVHRGRGGGRGMRDRTPGDSRRLGRRPAGPHGGARARPYWPRCTTVTASPPGSASRSSRLAAVTET